MQSIRKKIRSSRGQIDLTGVVDPNAPTNIDLGECPKCRHSVPLTDFVVDKDPIVANSSQLDEATRLVHELTDKLASIVQIESQIRKLIEHYSHEATSPRSTTNNNSGVAVATVGITAPSDSESNNSSNNVKHGHKTQVSQLLNLKPQHSRGNSGQFGQTESSPYDLKNLDASGQAALALLDTHQNVTFKLNGAAMVSPQEKLVGSAIDKRMTEFGRKFFNQYFMIGINKTKQIFIVLSKSTQNTKKDSSHKQYRHMRSFSSLEGAHFESAKDNMLRIWFRNARGYFLVSFSSQTEANTVMNLINIIAYNDEYSGINSSSGNSTYNLKKNDIIWAGYVGKKGKRMGLYTPRFLLLEGIDLLLFKSHTNFENGEDPSHKFSLLTCDFSQRADNKEIKFRKKMNAALAAPSTKKHDDNVFLTIRLFNEIERDDLLNLCAQTLGHAIAQGRTKMGAMASKLDDTLAADEDELSISTDSSHNEELKLAETGNDYETPGAQSSGNNASNDEVLPAGAVLRRQQSNVGKVVLHSMSITSGQSIGSVYNEVTIAQINVKFQAYFEQLDNTPRMYGASHIKALNRLAKRRASDIDFIETAFKGNEAKLIVEKKEDDYSRAYKLLDVLGKSMQSGAFLSERLYLHKAVWAQNKVMLENYELKLETFLRMQTALEGAFGNVDIAWLQRDQFGKAPEFHEKLLLCESGMKEAESILKSFMTQNVNKLNKKGAAKIWSNLKDKTKAKVFDNQPYRDAIYRICCMASKIGMYYSYLPQSKMNQNMRNKLLTDLRNITKPLTSFGQVVVVDMKVFLRAYLRRGSKNIYA